MLVSSVFYLTISNALTLRKDKSILFSRIVMISLILTSYLAFNNLFFMTLDKGIGIHGGLFHVTAFTQNLDLFIFIITPLLALFISLTLIFRLHLNIVAVYYLVSGNNIITLIKAFIYVIYLIYVLWTFDFMSNFIDYYSMEHGLDLGSLNCEGSSGNNSNDNPGNTNPDNSNGGGKGKKPKPNLHIKVGPETDSEKDLQRMANCLHDNVGHFMANTKKDAEETMCDFSETFDSKGKVALHKAFDSSTDVALLCNNCLAIICKNCCHDYSSSENTPT